MIVGKKKLTDKVYDRLGKSIPKTVLYDALQIICEELGNKISKSSFSILNFGTFYTYNFPGRINVNISSGELRKTKSFLNIRFVPDKVFSELINQKMLFLKKNIDN